jgi:hypothetical protein
VLRNRVQPVLFKAVCALFQYDIVYLLVLFETSYLLSFDTSFISPTSGKRVVLSLLITINNKKNVKCLTISPKLYIISILLFIKRGLKLVLI